MGVFKRIYTGKVQIFIQMGVPAGKAINSKTCYISDEDFEKEKRYCEHFQRKNTSWSNVYTFERQNVFKLSFNMYHSHKDGIYFHSEFNQSGIEHGISHRFIKVERVLQDFLVRNNEYSQQIESLIRNDSRGIIRIKSTSSNADSAKSTISIKKLTNFKSPKLIF